MEIRFLVKQINGGVRDKWDYSALPPSTLPKKMADYPLARSITVLYSISLCTVAQ